MQREHLEVVANLLDLASDGNDEEFWGQRFKQHLSKAMKRHGQKLRGDGCQGSLQGPGRLAEIIRARLELHEVVAERLERRAAGLDPQLAEAMAALRTTSHPLIEEAIALAASACSPPEAEVAEGEPEERDGRCPKHISCRQLLHFIDEVFASKASEHAECGPQDCHTLEWHFHSALESMNDAEGGSRNEHAFSVISAVQRYAPVRCEVEVFAKILQHRLPDTFAATVEEQKLAIRHVLRCCLDEAYQHRPVRERDAMWRIWARNGVPFEACESAIRHLYDDAHAEHLLDRLQDLAEHGEVPTRQLEQVLLRFQLGLAERSLSELVLAFREADGLDEGVLGREQVLGLCSRFGLRDSVLEEFPSIDRKLSDGWGASLADCVELFGRVLAQHRSNMP